MSLPSIIPASLLTNIQRITSNIFDLIYPTYDAHKFELHPIHRPFCKRCAAPIISPTHEASHTITCANCTDRSWQLDWARAAYKETGTVRHAIIQFKYNRKYHWKPWLVDWIENAFREYAAHIQWHAIVPVPLHPERKAYRTFNQAEEIAKSLCKRQNLSYLHCLRRTIHTPKQSLLNRSARLLNLSQAFHLDPKFDVRGLHLLIIDDVLTTGATTEACAKVLKKHGAAFVAALTVARA